MSAHSSIRLDLTQLKLQARELLRACQAGDPDARTRLAEKHPKLANAAPDVAEAYPISLADAQLVIARENGFGSWPQLKHRIQSPPDATSTFDLAVQAIINGNVSALRTLLAAEPELIQARSPSPHRSSLLHYVAANGIEGELQKSPANAAEVARALLEAGAEVDALAEAYHSRRQTTLNWLVSSVHPYRAGVQEALVEVLLDGGAAVDGVLGGGAPIRMALDFGYPAAAATLARRGARIDRVGTAAGVGRVDLMEAMFDEDGALQQQAEEHELESAFELACKNGQTEAIRFLLEKNVDVSSVLPGGGTGLHVAIVPGEGGGAPKGRLETVRFLIENGADQNVKHVEYNATAIAFASYNGRKEIVEYLLSQGATDVDVALNSAARQGHPEIVSMLMDAGAEPASSTLQEIESRGDEGMLGVLRRSAER